MFVNIYYYDLDDPLGVALIECDDCTTNFSSGKIGQTLTKALNSVKNGVESVVSLGYKEFDIPLNDRDGADALFQEFHSFFNERDNASLVVARGRGFDMFTQKKSPAWIVVEFSIVRSLLVDDSFW